MLIRTKYEITYDDNFKPLSATCRECKEQLPLPPPELESSAEIFRWMKDKFVEHLRLKHLREGEEVTREHIYDCKDDMSPLFRMISSPRNTTIQ
jgi:hypothetical protein